MKFSAVLLTFALALSVSAAPQQQKQNAIQNKGGAQSQNNNKNGQAQNGKNGQGNAKAANNANNNKGNNNAANNNKGNNNAANNANNNKGNNNAAAGGAAAAAGNNGGKAGNATATGNAGGNANAGGAANADSDPQTSLTLDPAVIAKGFANNGQDVPTAGQVASLTSTNNFINFCLTVPNLPLTNGQQVTGGSCNPAPMGIIPSSDNMPSSKFVSPKNGDTIKSNTAFTITMAINNLETGNFVNAQENYFAAPQQTNGGGIVKGHSHVVVEQMTSFQQTTPTNPKVFAFFKGLNDAAAGGQLTADVTAGLPAGTYKLSSINTAANHQPVLVPIAQHGSLDDAVYFSITDDGKPAANNVLAPPAAAAAAPPAAGAAANNGTAQAGGAAANNNQAGSKGNATGAAANNNNQAAQQNGGNKANNNQAGQQKGNNNQAAQQNNGQKGGQQQQQQNNNKGAQQNNGNKNQQNQNQFGQQQSQQKGKNGGKRSFRRRL